MTCYVVRSGGQKKKNILRQRELALRGAIRRGELQDKVEKTAEKVRSAHLGVIKVLLHEAAPARAEDEKRRAGKIQKLEEERDYWTSLPVQEIIAVYSIEGDEDVIIERKKW